MYLSFVVLVGHATIVNSIKFFNPNKKEVRDIFSSRFLKYIGKKWNQYDIEVDLQKLKTKMINKGFFNFTLGEPSYEFNESGEVNLKYFMELGQGYNFYINGNKLVSRTNIINGIKKVRSDIL